VLTKCPFVKQVLSDGYEKFEKEHERKHMTWAECQAVFLGVTMTDEQHVREMNDLLTQGMHESETYHQYALHISHDMKVFEIEDKSYFILQLLHSSLPAQGKDSSDARLDKSKKSFTTVSFWKCWEH